jgi:hypothetical protein
MAYYKVRIEVWCDWDPVASELEEIVENIRTGHAICTKREVVDVLDRPQDLASVLIRTSCRRALFEELEKVNQICSGAVDRPTISALAVEKPCAVRSRTVSAGRSISSSLDTPSLVLRLCYWRGRLLDAVTPARTGCRALGYVQ